MLSNKQRNINNNLTTVNHNILAFGHYEAIGFVSLDDGKVSFYHLMNQTVNGCRIEGISCIVGHKTESIFAIGDICHSPRILLFTYPDIRCIAELKSETPSGFYESLKFVDTEYLVALTFCSNFYLEVWNWRNEKILLVKQTDFIVDDQLIRCSPLYPLTVVQMARKSSKINFWEIYFSIDFATTHKTEITLPTSKDEKAIDLTACYDLDGSLYAMNKCGIVWHISPVTRKTTEIINFENHSEDDIKMVIYKGGIILAGLNSTLRYFKKVENIWTSSWTVETNYKLNALLCSNQNTLISVSANGIVQKLIEDKSATTLCPVTELNRVVNKIAIINPLGQYLVMQTNVDDIFIVSIELVTLIAKHSLNGISCIDSHPSNPILGIATNFGKIFLLSLDEPDQPILFAEYFLSSSKIQNLKLISHSNAIVACDADGDFFLIQRQLNCNDDIKKFIHLDRVPLDLSAIEISGMAHVLALASATTTNEMQEIASAANCVVYIRLEIDAEFGHKLFTIPLSRSYSSMQFKAIDNAQDVIAVKCHSSEIDMITIKVNAFDVMEFNVQRTVQTAHTLDATQLFIDDKNVVSCGSDGKITVWDKDTLKILGTLLAYTSCTGGVKQAICDPLGRYLMTLGHSEHMICFKINNNSDAISFEFVWINTFLTINNVQGMVDFKITVAQSSSCKSWKESDIERKEAHERQYYENQLKSISHDLNQIKETVVYYMNANELEPTDERFPIQFFNVDVSGTDRLFELKKQEFEIEKEKLETAIAEEKLRIGNMKKYTWDCFNVKPAKLRSISTSIYVENYPLTSIDERLCNEHTINEILNVPKLVNRISELEPWIRNAVIDDEIQWPDVEHENVRNKSSERFSMVAGKVIDQHLSAKATSSHHFIAPMPMPNEKVDVSNVCEVNKHNIRVYHNIVKLRKYFNDIFAKMCKAKENEMKLLKERNERLKQIHADINRLQELNGLEITIFDPISNFEYKDDEKPQELFQCHGLADSILQLPDNLHPIQPSKCVRTNIEQSFYDRALNDMMNGVLEICWEDELKKDVPKPDCLLKNISECDYSSKEREEVLIFNEKLKQLRLDRDKYLARLFSEMADIENRRDLQVQQLNTSIGSTLKAKVSAQFAICTEELRILMCLMDSFSYSQIIDKEKQIAIQKEQLKGKINDLVKIQATLESNLNTCKTQFEELTVKDQLLDRQFKSFFVELVSPVVIDQSYRIFKRRPKGKLITCQSPAILNEMARRIVARTNSEANRVTLLPDECYQYLQFIDAADKFSNAPNSIDQAAWQHLCKMRRSKIEVEFKLRSVCAILAEAEATSNACNKIINSKKAKLAHCDNKLAELQEQKENHLKNRKVQICFKRGNIQIPLTGRIEDFDDTILLSKNKLAKTNAIIEEAAMKKMKIKQNADLCRRRVQYFEWKRTTLQMKIEDLKTFINRIEKCVITKEIQNWLSEKIQHPTKPVQQKKLKKQDKLDSADVPDTPDAMTRKINQMESAIARERKRNHLLDRQIATLKIEIDDKLFDKDYMIHEKDIIGRSERMLAILKRSQLVRKIQQQHAELLELSATLELQQLRTYPTLNIPANQFNL